MNTLEVKTNQNGRVFFKNAFPIWAKGENSKLNSSCFFKCVFEGETPKTLRIAGWNSYRIYLNGDFLAFGPARASHGYARVDEFELDCLQGENVLLIEACAYNTKTYCTLNQPGFLIAEVLDKGEPIAWTGRDFSVSVFAQRLRKVNRYSFQRGFGEAYSFLDSMFSTKGEQLSWSDPEIVAGASSYQPRLVSYPKYDLYSSTLVEEGKFVQVEKEIPSNPWLHSDKFACFLDEELEVDPYRYGLSLQFELSSCDGVYKEGDFCTFALPGSKTGFIGFSCDVEEEAEVYIFFDEIDLNFGKSAPINVSFNRIGCVNAIVYKLPKGHFSYLSFEPYSGKYFRIVVKKGKIASPSIWVRGYENPDSNRFVFESDREDLNLIVAAAKNSFVTNSVDFFTDCPSRERAGWLCDSYFTANAEQLFTGHQRVESAFLDNYLHATSPLPKGMVPMCYPADFYDDTFIPNWALFLVVEIADRYKRTGNKADIAGFYELVAGIFEYFKRFENEFGLLENLESWVFVEWSKANDKEFLEGVNFPSNMMYAYALLEAGKCFDNAKWRAEGEAKIQSIRNLSYNGSFFVDNAIRKDGELEPTNNTSESCQYYAFFTGVADKESYPALLDVLVKHFGAKRKDNEVYPNVFKSNAFIGNFLRLIMLKNNGEKAKLEDECIGYFLKMAKLTGSLWEMDWPYGCSLNHGFTSYVANLLVDYLIGYGGREGHDLHFSSPCVFCDCHVEIPLGDEKLVYDRKNGKVTLQVPQGYNVLGFENGNQK